ncbi:hypothetical protein OG417_12570 [Actinoallomurus sp. NBC_01490]|uniref:hypothetical protein n=1 Tax=Actinoallomurus sp. NBC_01490 TaxID=2903557 RepID=UPI002E3441AB|nr:hypothetical protein [Actinoallomurus sp. NBC_01490]
MRQRFSALRMASVGLGGIALTATLAPAPAFAETVRSSINRNVELIIGVTNVSSTQVKLGTVTVTLVDGLGHSGANYDFRLYIASTLIKNDNDT